MSFHRRFLLPAAIAQIDWHFVLRGVLRFMPLWVIVCIGRTFLWTTPGENDLLDFGSLVASGRAAAAGLNPYDIYPLVWHVSFSIPGTDFYAVNMNPPISLPVFELLARFDPATSYRVWYVVSFGLYLLVIRALIREYREHVTPIRAAWPLAIAGFWEAQHLGQVYVPMLVAVTGAWLLLRRDRSILAGILIGLMVAIKPNFLVWPVLLLLAGHWSAGLAAVGTAGLLSIAPLPRYGVEIYSLWIEAVNRLDPLTKMGNNSLNGLMGRLGQPWIASLLSAVLLLTLAAIAWRYRPSTLHISALALVASLLASPITWVPYTIVLLPIFFARPWTTALRGAALILMIPVGLTVTLAVFFPSLYVLLGGVYLWGLLLVLAALMNEVYVTEIRPRITSPHASGAPQQFAPEARSAS